MKQKLGFFASRWGIIVVGALIGIMGTPAGGASNRDRLVGKLAAAEADWVSAEEALAEVA